MPEMPHVHEGLRKQGHGAKPGQQHAPLNHSKVTGMASVVTGGHDAHGVDNTINSDGTLGFGQRRALADNELGVAVDGERFELSLAGHRGESGQTGDTNKLPHARLRWRNALGFVLLLEIPG